MKLLNKFCLKLSKFGEIFHSEEMKIFLSNTTDVVKALETLPPQTYEQILLKYRRVFVDYYEVNIHLLLKAYEVGLAKIKINEFISFLKKALANLRVNN